MSYLGSALLEFFVSFIGDGMLGMLAGRVLLWAIPWMREDRLAESTLTLALAYGAFVLSERLLHYCCFCQTDHLASAPAWSSFNRSRTS